jgi:hypothetical protein
MNFCPFKETKKRSFESKAGIKEYDSTALKHSRQT